MTGVQTCALPISFDYAFVEYSLSSAKNQVFNRVLLNGNQISNLSCSHQSDSPKCWSSIWWDIMVNGLILLVFRWHILEITETWRRSKENCSSDAMSVYVCESNKNFEKTWLAESLLLSELLLEQLHHCVYWIHQVV